MARTRDEPNAWHSPEDCLELDRMMRLSDRDSAFWAKVSQVNWILAINPRVESFRLRELAHTALAMLDVAGAGRRLRSESLASWWAKVDRPSFSTDQHLAVFDDANWIRYLLLERRRDHPLRWSILLAVLMSPNELTRLLYTAPQMQMNLKGDWEKASREREDLLKPKVWRLLLDGRSVKSVADATGIAENKIRHALRLNPKKQFIRDQIISESERQAKREVVMTLKKLNPLIKRADLMQNHSAEVRWLEKHDWPWMSKVLANELANKFIQKSLDFDNKILTK